MIKESGELTGLARTVAVLFESVCIEADAESDSVEASWTDASGEGSIERDIDATPLDEAVRAYLAGDGSLAPRIEGLATEMLANAEVEPIARAVATLTEAAGEPPDPTVFAVASSIMSPAVLGRLARRMGDETDGSRRAVYHRISRTIGHDMALAIRDALAETTDATAGRHHCDALVAMGPAGRPVIEAMAADDNRFLVRSAVAMLGEIGGDGASGLIRETLTHPDVRVRREALRSLAKLGDPEAGPLVAAMLEDGDQAVRVAAATAAGALKFDRAARPVTALLETTRDPEELTEIIQALGKLEDPGAVIALEKRAVRSLVSRPPVPVRIAAYMALHQIGTPHARRLLDQARADKQEEVRTAVTALLDAS